MKLWLVCFILLFSAAKGLQWLGQFSWVSGAELSLPLVIVGGLGLAIASNASTWKALGLLAAPPARPDAAARPPVVTASPPVNPPSPSPVSPNALKEIAKPAASISFDIRKPQR